MTKIEKQRGCKYGYDAKLFNLVQIQTQLNFRYAYHRRLKGLEIYDITLDNSTRAVIKKILTTGVKVDARVIWNLAMLRIHQHRKPKLREDFRLHGSSIRHLAKCVPTLFVDLSL